MDSFSADTRLSSSHPPRNGAWLSPLRPALGRASPCSWHDPNDAFDPPFVPSCTDPDYHHISFATTHAFQHASTHFNLLYPDSLNMYPSPPSSSPTSKSAIPLPGNTDDFASLYSTHLVGVLDSPPVLRREDLVPQKPLTPPPTAPQLTRNLPDTDIDAPLYSPEVQAIDEEPEMDEYFSSLSASSSPHMVQPDHLLSPISPTSDTPHAEALSIASSQDFQELEPSNALFSPCGLSAPPALDFCHPSPLLPHQPSSLLGVDINAPCPLWAPIGMRWDPDQPSESDPEPPSAPTSSSSLISLTDYNEPPVPSSPLISRLDLPDFEDDRYPKILPSSPSRRSCLHLPDSDNEMPGESLLSLPGAATDDSLIHRIASPSAPVPLMPNQPLLFIEDPRDVPLPRSPSPEEFDLCISQEDITDPELAQLFALRKRSTADERTPRRGEAPTDDVDLFKGHEARKMRKRERERSKELNTLLRLKLGNGVSTYSQEQRSPESDPQRQARRRGAIGSMSQLVAQMVYRRNDTSRSLVRRGSSNAAREYVPSPLSNVVSADDIMCEADI